MNLMNKQFDCTNHSTASENPIDFLKSDDLNIELVGRTNDQTEA